MLNHTNLIEMLPINVVNRAIARANYDAAEASIDRIVRALAWLLNVVPSQPTQRGVWRRRSAREWR